MHATNILKEEHDLIERVFTMLEFAVVLTNENKPAPEGFLAWPIEFPYRDEQDRMEDSYAAGRHTHLTEMLRSGASVTEAKELARYADVRMTMRYTNVGIEGQAKAVAKLPTDPYWLRYGYSSTHGDRHNVTFGTITQSAKV